MQFLDDLNAINLAQNPPPVTPAAVRYAQPAVADSHSLPKMNLPKFSGSYSEWENFRDLFRSLVHRRADLDASVKFYYLRTHLTGEGLDRIKTIPIAADQYGKAWNNNLLRKIFNVKPMISESANELKRVYTEIISPIDSLRTLGRTDADLGNDLIVHLIVQQFEGTTKKDWKKSLDNTTDVPSTLVELKEFVESQLATLEALDDNVEVNSGSKTRNSKHKQKLEHDSSTAHTFKPFQRTRLKQNLLVNQNAHCVILIIHFLSVINSLKNRYPNDENL